MTPRAPRFVYGVLVASYTRPRAGLGFRLVTVFTLADSAWTIDLPPQIHAVTAAEAAGTPTGRFGESARESLWHPRGLLRAAALFRMLRERNVTAMIMSGYSSLLHLRLLQLAARSGIKVFLRSDSNIRGDRARGLKAWMKHRIVRWAIRCCDAILPMGRLGWQYYEKYGADSDRMYFVPHEPDYPLFESVDAEALDTFRREHGLAPDRRRILYCGRLVPVKRVDLLIDAFAAIAAARPDWDLLIAGDGILRASLEARVPEDLRERVHWLGFCEVERLRLAYHASNVFVLPSEFEPWAVVINEAVAAGLVVVSSDVVGAANELVVDRESGRLFKSGSAGSLRDALLDVTDEETYARYLAATPEALAAWRCKGDPVAGVREALASVSLVGSTAGAAAPT
jgi:glycosyltransferase involved in cell wall biosynthesis